MAWFGKMKKYIEARRMMMQNTSRLMNMQFQSKENFSSVPLLTDFYLFRTNQKNGISNIISGSSQHEEEFYKIFDYKYTVRAGNTTATFQQTVLFIESKDFIFPKFYFYPKRKFSKWFYNLGFHSKKTITNNKMFDQNYSFMETAIDDDRLKLVLNPKFIEIINQQKGLYVEGNNFHFIIYYHGELLEKHAEIKRLFQTGLQLIGTVKKNRE